MGSVDVGFKMKRRTGTSLLTYAKRLEKNGRQLQQNCLEFIRDTAVAKAPLGKHTYFDDDGHSHPGWLKESIQLMPIGGSPDHVKVRAFYGIYVEQGTRNMRGQPFFGPAVELCKQTVLPVGTAALFKVRMPRVPTP